MQVCVQRASLGRDRTERVPGKLTEERSTRCTEESMHVEIRDQFDDIHGSSWVSQVYPKIPTHCVGRQKSETALTSQAKHTQGLPWPTESVPHTAWLSRGTVDNVGRPSSLRLSRIHL